jgi:acetyl-CoA carboxylase carboxyltransferase component
LAWSDAEVTVMNAGAAVYVLHRKKLAVAPKTNGKRRGNG